MRDTWMRIVHASGARVYSLAASMAVLVLTARVLGPQGRGVVAAATSWATLFSTFGYLSLGQVAIHRASTRPGRAWLAPTLGSLLAITAVVSLAGWALVAVAYVATGGSAFAGLSGPVLALAFAALPLLVWEQYGSSLLMALDRLDIYNRAQVVGRTLGLLLLVGLLASGWRVFAALAATLLGQAVVAGWGVRHLLSAAGERVRPDRGTVGELLRGGMRLHLNAVGAFVVASADVLMINQYLGTRATGYYQLAMQLNLIVMLVPQAAGMVLYGRVAELGPDVAWRQQRRVLALLVGATAAFAVVAAAAAPFAIPLVAGRGFAPSVAVFQVLVLSLVGTSLSTLMAPQWIGRGLFWQASAITVAAGAANLASNALVIPRYGILGAAWVYVGTSLLSVLSNGGMALWLERRLRGAPSAGLAGAAA
jgi:antigen flippase